MRTNPLVLLVDDEDIFLEIASVKLQAEGFETIMTHDFRDALEKAERLLPDVVLSDIYMPPGRNGWELALELRRNPKTCDIKIAFFTSLRDPWAELREERKEVVQQLGKVTFLSKVDDVGVLANRVMALLHQ